MQNQTGLQSFNSNPYLYTQPQALPAPVVTTPASNDSYPLNAPNLTGQGQGDFFTSTGAPVNYTATSTALPAPLPAPFKAASTGADFNNQNFTLNLTDAANTQFKPVPAITAVAPDPFANTTQTTTIPGYTPPGGNFNMLA
ncbi:MAG: hypothetical protein QE263_02430 [Vampirovibrionales bacterium]|nr:hypothetical protein [Vampirovibrionales bacterium]